MTKRIKSEGSVFWSRTEKTWVAKFTLPDGREKRKRSKDKQVVRDWLFELRKAVSENRTLPDEKTTFSQFADRFLRDVAKHTLKPKTYSSYEWILRKHILPEIGHLKLTAIRPHDLQGLYSHKLNDGLSRKTVRHIHATTRRVLNEAVKWGLIYQNPCDAVTPPRTEKSPPRVWTIDQAQEFLRATAEHKWHAIYLIALTTGARRGEILGMEWQNIDWTRNTVSIVKTISEVNGRAVVSDPKTAKARRVIVLPDSAVGVLKPHKKIEGWVFETSAGTPIAPRNLLRHFYSVLETLDIPRIRFHDLRHTTATILLQRDVHPKKVQELLGHSSITRTLDTYSHVIPGIDSQVATEMDEVFKL